MIARLQRAAVATAIALVGIGVGVDNADATGIPLHRVGTITMTGDGTKLTETLDFSALRYGQRGAPPQAVLDAYSDPNLATSVEVDTSAFVYGTMTFSYKVGRVPLTLYLPTDGDIGTDVSGGYPFDDPSAIFEVGGHWVSKDSEGNDAAIVLLPHQAKTYPMWMQLPDAISNTEARIPRQALNVMTWTGIPDPSPPRDSYSGPQAANCGGSDDQLLPFAHLPFGGGRDGDHCVPLHARNEHSE